MKTSCSRPSGLIAAIALLSLACDPIRLVRVSGPVLTAPVEECVLDNLRSNRNVSQAGVSDDGVVYAVLAVPSPLRAPEQFPEVAVRFAQSDSWGGDLTLEMLWVGPEASPEYREFATRTLRELHFELTTTCVPPSVAALSPPSHPSR